MEVYIDDIVIKSSSTSNHFSYLSMAFERMRRHSLKMTPLKCAFSVQTENSLGFHVHQKGIKVDKNKAKTIIKAQPPKTKKDLQRLLG